MQTPASRAKASGQKQLAGQWRGQGAEELRQAGCSTEVVAIGWTYHTWGREQVAWGWIPQTGVQG